MDKRTRSTIGNVDSSTLNIAKHVVSYLQSIGKPLPNHPDTGYPVIWGKGASSEHATGNALDFMVTGNPAVGDLIADYLWKNRVKFGLIHVIWKQRIKSTRVSPGVWRHMADRGSVTENHHDHPHAYFDGRDVAPPETSTKPPTAGDKAPPYPWGARTVSRRSTRLEGVRVWQARMRERGWRIAVDGIYGRESERVCRAFQKEKGLTVDGILGPETWRAAWTAKVTP